MGGRPIVAGLEASEPVAAVARADRSRDGSAAPLNGRAAPLATSLPTTLLAAAALVGYAVVRMSVGLHEPLGVGLASVPLFFAAAFLPRWRAIAVGLGTILATLLPLTTDRGPWSLMDVGIVVELVILVVASSRCGRRWSARPRLPPARPPTRPCRPTVSRPSSGSPSG